MSANDTQPHFDLKGMIELQRQYAVDLTKMPVDTVDNTAITSLTTKLNDIYSSFNGSQANSNSVLLKQQIVNDILDTEKQRLDAKKENIDTAMSGQKRMIALNNNYQKRYAAYTKMMIAIIVGIVIYIFMNKLMILMPFIPESIFYTIIIVILGTIVFYIYLVWLDISRRELTNFDELSIPAPDLSGAPTAASTAGSSTPGSASGGAAAAKSFTDCTSGDCCGTGTTWYSEYGCVVNTPSPPPAK
jgi:hypothetical protein